MGKCKFRVAINLVLIQNEKVLLMRRANTGWNDGMYALMGGHVEDGENPIQAVIRETKEELGINIDAKNIEPLLTMAVSPDHIYLYFGCEKFNGKIVNNEPNECDDIKFFSKTEFPQNIIGPDKIEIIFSGSGLKFETFGFEEKPKIFI